MRSLLPIAMAVVLTAGGHVLEAQEPGYHTAGTTLAQSGQWVRARESRSALLQRRVSLNLTNVKLSRALEEIARQAGLKIGYSGEVSRSPVKVSLRSDDFTAIDAIGHVLDGTGFEPFVSLRGDAVLVSAIPLEPEAPQASGRVSGTVTDAKTGLPLQSAEIVLEGTTWRGMTDAGGKYQVGEVTAAAYTMTARRVGYTKGSRSVRVSDGTDVTVDFALEQAALNLEALVVTGTADQAQQRTLGNAIGRLNVAENIVVAPPSKLQDLLSLNVPGVRVLRGSGEVGTGGVTQIRGAGSLSLSNEPLVYIDGVRSNNVNAQANQGYRGGFASPSRINDLNPEEIESIEVLKGPSAATIYGTEASNGVIQITTKRGKQGRPIYEMHSGAGATWLMNPEGRYPTVHYIGRDGAIHDYRPLELSASRGERPVFTTGGSYALGGNVSGGSERLRYLFSADIGRDEGYLSYNWQNRYAAHANLSYSSSNDKVKLDLGLGMMRSKARGASGNNTVVTRAFVSPCSLLNCEPDPANPNTTGWNGPSRGFNPSNRPEDYDHIFAYDNNDRTVFSLTIRHNPMPGFRHRLLVGPDFTNNFSSNLVERVPADRVPVPVLGDGFTGTTEYRATFLTLDYGASADWSMTKSFIATTSAGVQYYHRLSQQVTAEGRGFSIPGPAGLSGAATVTTAESYVENKTLGVYAQEQLAYKNRLFLTGALRADDNSAFGESFNAVYYPKFALSWIASEEPFLANSNLVSQLRFRGAWGRAGQQPSVFAAIQTYQTVLQRTGQSGITPASIGNPDLKPEVGEELEVGFDAGLFKQRFGIEFTFYNKKVKDAILSAPLKPSTGFPGTQLTNIAMTRNRGIELAIDGAPIRSRNVGLDLRFTLATNDARIIDLGSRPPTFRGFAFVSQWDVQGFAPGAYFYKRVVSSTIEKRAVGGVQLPIGTNAMCEGGTDLGHGDGTVVSCAQAPRIYTGKPTPSWYGSFSSTVSLGKRLRILGLVDYVGGLRQMVSDIFTAHTARFTSRAAVEGDPVLSAYVGRLLLNGDLSNAGAAGLMKAGFAKLRIVSASYDLPERVARWVGASRGSITFSGENLVILWREQKTSFGEPWVDPETVGNISSGFAPGLVDNVLPQAARFRTVVRLTF